MSKITIGVTDCGKYNSYAKWIAEDPDVEAVKLSHRENTFSSIERCHGILLTGGEDVHPRFYNKPEYLPYCDKEDMDEKRDEFELEVVRYTQEKSLPVLGICRGLQIANVYFGGTLIPDLPTFGKFNHAKVSGYDLYHSVYVDPNSSLKKIVHADTGVINSAHHQSAGKVAPALVTNAITIDGVVEGIERLYPEGKPYLQLVQWHPERMNDLQNAFTRNIKKSFIDAVLELINKVETEG